MFLRQIFDPQLAQYAYLIGCQRSGEAVVVDPERDVDRYLQLAAENGLRLAAVADTHIHADYLSGARELIERHGAKGFFSAEGGEDWQFEWARDLPGVTMLRDGDFFRVGKIRIEARLTPGHTPEHLSFLVTDEGGGADQPMALLSGDFIFVGDVGRPDLLESAAGQVDVMEPAARTLFGSLSRTRDLPGFLQILPAHGAGSACGKALGAVPSSVLDYERRNNAALRLALEGEEDDFVSAILDGQPEPPLYFARMKRDNRAGPRLLDGGFLPEPKRLDRSELGERVGARGRVILDLRTGRDAFMERHVKGSLTAPALHGFFSVVAGSYVEEDARILLLVDDAGQVEAAVRDLVRIGLDHVLAWMPVGEALAQDEFCGSIRSITTAEMESLAGGEVLDVRRADEFAAGHVKGAIHVAHTRLAEQLEKLPATGPMVVHCASGMRASLAAAYLASLGREVVHADGAFSDIPKSMRA
jgi:hydroxyacylglutathione hydrolase